MENAIFRIVPLMGMPLMEVILLHNKQKPNMPTNKIFTTQILQEKINITFHSGEQSSLEYQSQENDPKMN